MKNEARCRRLVDEAINTFSLNLQGNIVLTEAATGYYALTPIIAALSGAEYVYALTKDSRYGSADKVKDETMELALSWSVKDKIEVLFSRDDHRIGQADIVTNLGFLRPLDSTFLHRLKSTVVIPLMWETWEYRDEDLDLKECRRLDIPVLGTNEHHPGLETFRYIGQLAIKLLFKLDVEIFRSKIVVIGGGEFGSYAVQSLRNSGASVVQIRSDKGESLQLPIKQELLSKCDAIVIVEHSSHDLLIGQGGQITAKQLYELNPSVCIAHIAGGVDQNELEAVGIPFQPSCLALPGYMSISTDYLGPLPLIDLHTAGLKVGAMMARAKKSGLYGFEAELAVLKETNLAQGFSGYHNRETFCNELT